MPPVSWLKPRLASLVLGLLAAVPSWAQTATERQACSAGRELTQEQYEAIKRSIESKGDRATLEHAQRRVEAVYRFIKLNGDSSAESTPKPAPAFNLKRATANARPRGGPVPADNANSRADSNPSPDRWGIEQSLVAKLVPASTATAGTESIAALPQKVKSAQPLAALKIAADASTAPLPLASTQLDVTPSVARPQEPEETPVKQIARVEPVFTPQLRDNLRSGSAQVRFTIEPHGTVSRVTPSKATHVLLSMAAVEAVSELRFEPVQQD